MLCRITIFLKCIWIKTQLSRNLTWIWLQRLHESKKQHTIIRTRIRLLDFNWSCHCRRLLLEKIYATKTSSSSLHLTNTQIIYLPPMSFKIRRNLYQNNLYAILPTLDQFHLIAFAWYFLIEPFSYIIFCKVKDKISWRVKRHLNQLIDSLKPLPLQKKNAELKKNTWRWREGISEQSISKFRSSYWF